MDPSLALRVLYVDPGGDDRAEGTRDEPLRTLTEGLEARRADVLRLLPGVHGGGSLLLARSVRIEGTPTATVSGHVFVGADRVSLRDLVLLEGLATGLAEHVELTNLRIAAGDRAQALSFHRTQARLRDLDLEDGPEAGLQVTASTVSAIGLGVRSTRALRAVRLDGGRLELEGARITGGTIASVQASAGSTLRISDSEIGPTRGSGILILDGATATVTTSRILGAAKMGLLVRGGRLSVRGSTISGPGEASVAVSGAWLDLRGGRLEAGAEAAVILASFGERLPEVRLAGVRVDHGERAAALVQAGRLELRHARLVGVEASTLGSAAARPGSAVAAIVAHGPKARLDLRDVEFRWPPGPALAASGEAEVRLQRVQVHHPSGDGVVLDGLEQTRARLDALTVRSCRGPGTGVRALASTRVHLNRLIVTDCEDGGMVVGVGSRVWLADAQIRGGRYGAAAFGDSTLYVSGSTLAGAAWSAYASCADGARVIDDGDNRFAVPAVLCP